MPKQKVITRKERRAINQDTNNNQERPKNTTEWLNSTKSEYQNITSAMKEVGAVSPGSGLMPDQMLKISKKEYLNFVNSTFVEALKGLEKDLFFEKAHDYVCINEFIIADKSGNKITASNHEKKNEWYLKIESANLNADYIYQQNSTEATSLKITAGSIFYSIFSQRKNSESYKIESCKPFNKIDFLEFLKDLPDDCQYSHYFTEKLSCKNPANKNPSPFNCSFNPAGITTIISGVAASLLTNSTTTPTTSYNNSTNTSIISANSSTTTSNPKQDDGSIDQSYLSVVIGTSIIIGMFLCFIGYCCWKKTRPSGRYNVQEKEHLYGQNSKSGNYKKFTKVDNDISNKRSALSKIEEEQEETMLLQVQNGDGQEQPKTSVKIESLLSSSGQSNNHIANNEIEISDDQIEVVQQALKGNCQFNLRKAEKTPPSKPPRAQQTQVDVYAEPSTILNMDSGEPQGAQCAKIGGATEHKKN